jgi:hypothetical protein
LAGAILVAVSACSAPQPATVSKTAAMTAATTAAPENLREKYDELRRSGGSVFEVDPAASAVRVFVFRGGRAPRLGHNHVLSAPRFQGYIYLPPGAQASSDAPASFDTRARGARFELAFRLDELVIDDPELRRSYGPAFASTLAPEDLKSLREHMLGPDNLQADRFPIFGVQGLEIAGEAPRFAAKVGLNLHGHVQEIWLPLEVEGLPERIAVRGSFVLAQSDFGVQPYSVLGGFIAVEDRIVVEFRLEGKPLGHD